MNCLVTGVGARGQVGEIVARTLAERDYTMIVVDRQKELVDERVADLSRAGARAFGHVADLTDVAAVERLAKAVAAEHDEKLDALVNLAGGFSLSGPLAESDVSVSDRMFAINYRTAYLTTRSLMPLLQKARGAIVFFASESVLEGQKTGGTSAYAAAKMAVVGLMRSVADEGRESGVRANALAPTSIRTAANEKNMGKDAKYIEREDVGNAVAFLLSPEARTITGQLIRLR